MLIRTFYQEQIDFYRHLFVTSWNHLGVFLMIVLFLFFLVYVFMWYACTFPITMGVFLVYVNMNPTILAAATACP